MVRYATYKYYLDTLYVMVKQRAPDRIYTTLTPELLEIRKNLKEKLCYGDSEMIREGLRCLAKREGLLNIPSAEEAAA